MPTLVLRFPGGLYHATPIGHHVNEGLVEWPPSPWRLLRALVACGYATQRWREVPPAGRRLVEALASVLPEYRLPPAALGHSRHYMPTTVLDKGREKTTLVLDAFADVGRGTVWVRWPTQLDAEAAVLLDTLARHLGYLGRSESWVEAESVADDVAMPAAGRAFPHVEGNRPARGFEQLMLTAPEVPQVFAGWRTDEMAAARAALPAQKGKRPSRTELKRAQDIEAAYPPDLLACVQLDTAWWKERQWSQAPGTRCAVYWRESKALEVGPPPTPRRPVRPRVEAFLLALTTPSGSRSALPTIARAVPQAELLHRALISRLGKDAPRCPELTGRGTDGAPLRDHGHAHLLPVDLDADGHLDHIVVYARIGLGELAARALQSLERTWTKGGVGELQLAIAGHGSLADLRRLPGRLGESVDALLGPASTWVSATPFVPPRHLKKRGRSSLEGQIEEELSVRGLPPAQVVVLPWTPERLSFRHVVRRRRPQAPQPPVDAAFAIRLTFGRPVPGPILLGYASHFGLGRFCVST